MFLLLNTYPYNGIKKALSKVFKALNLTDISITHSCRHTYASMLYAADVSEKSYKSNSDTLPFPQAKIFIQTF